MKNRADEKVKKALFSKILYSRPSNSLVNVWDIVPPAFTDRNSEFCLK